MSLLAPTARLAEVVSPAPRDTWQAVVAGDPEALPEQEPAWTDAVCAAGAHRDVSRLYRFEDGRSFVLPLVRRTRSGARIDASFPDGWGIGGLAGDGRDLGVAAAVLEDLRHRPALLTRLRPHPLDGRLWSEAAPAGVVLRPRRAHVLDLADGLDAVRSGFSGSTRRNVNKSGRSGLRISDTATAEHLAAYHRLFVLSLHRWAERSREPRWLAERRGTRRDPLTKLHAMAEALGDDFRLLLAWEGDDPVAGAIVLYGQSAHYTRGAMDRDRAGPTRATYRLQWQAIEEAVERGCRHYHLGDTGSSSSLARFKEGFGARSVDYADLTVERLPITRSDRVLRTAVKRAIGFRDGD